MGGYVNESRRKDTRPTLVLTDTRGGISKTPILIPSRQDTYSFRTGKRAPSDAEQLRQDAVLQPYVQQFSTADTGHEFRTTTVELRQLSHPQVGIEFNKTVDPLRLSGPLVIERHKSAENMVLDLTSLVNSTSQSEARIIGTRALTAAAPTHSNASLNNFLIELKRDGVPSLVGSMLLRKGVSFRTFADEFLNAEFGWAPLISDVEKLLRSVVSSSTTVQQMRRDSGRTVRRRFRFPIDATFKEYPPSGESPNTLSGVYSGWTPSATTLVQDSFRKETWFSGAFTYYLDMGDELLNRLSRYEQLANKLLGTRLTPGVLWEAAPWSWLADWFADVGTVLDSASQLQDDGLVIRWGYLMRQTDVTRTLKSTVGFRDGPVLQVSNVWVATRKQRWKATPFGFGLLESGFSARQWAILAALGMTRSPKITL